PGPSGLWRRRPTSVGVLCRARFCLADNKRYKPRQTRATHADTPRGAVQSRRESLVVCPVKKGKIACKNYTLSPIMSTLAYVGYTPESRQTSGTSTGQEHAVSLRERRRR